MSCRVGARTERDRSQGLAFARVIVRGMSKAVIGAATAGMQRSQNVHLLPKFRMPIRVAASEDVDRGRQSNLQMRPLDQYGRTLELSQRTY